MCAVRRAVRRGVPTPRTEYCSLRSLALLVGGTALHTHMHPHTAGEGTDTWGRPLTDPLFRPGTRPL